MNILLISDNRYPDGDAGAVRERVLADTLIEAGHSIFRVGRFCNSNINDIGGVKCYSIADNGKYSKNNTWNLLMFNTNTLKTVKKVCVENRIDAFLITGLKARLLSRIKSYALKNHIKLVYNSVELYSSNQFKYGKYSRHYINNRLIAERIIDRKFSVIAISTYLTKLFRDRDIKVATIPFVLEEKDKYFYFTDDNIIELAYVGRPSRRKDFLTDIVNALAELSQTELERIRLTIVGVNKEQLINNFSISAETLSYLGDKISPMGLVPHEKAVEILRKADFTVLFRSETDVNAKAGFPTKVTESLFNSIPVISNLTSDLAEYIIDGVSGFVVDDHTSLADCYRKALGLSKSAMVEMKKNAQSVALDRLLAMKYTDVLTGVFFD